MFIKCLDTVCTVQYREVMLYYKGFYSLMSPHNVPSFISEEQTCINSIKCAVSFCLIRKWVLIQYKCVLKNTDK